MKKIIKGNRKKKETFNRLSGSLKPRHAHKWFPPFQSHFPFPEVLELPILNNKYKMYVIIHVQTHKYTQLAYEETGISYFQKQVLIYQNKYTCDQHLFTNNTWEHINKMKVICTE